jgi:aerobic C4-dicarboxylate transport protein
LTQVIGNGVATLVIAKWTGELDAVRMHRELERSEGNMRNIDARE